MEPKLYIIATPLGNLEDITRRALKMFNQVKVFFAEDTREFKKLLALLGVSMQEKEIFSCADHNLSEATERALKILKEGRSIGFVCDRGTPNISDPGASIVRAARSEGIGVEPIPGPSSVTTALSVSGIDANRFLFLGFLPTENKKRATLFESAFKLDFPFVFFESPRRIKATLEELKKIGPDSKIFIGREMTKKFETYIFKRLEELVDEDSPELGEYVVAVDPVVKESSLDWSSEVALRVSSDKEWSKEIAKRYDCAASELYNALQKMKRRD